MTRYVKKQNLIFGSYVCNSSPTPKNTNRCHVYLCRLPLWQEVDLVEHHNRWQPQLLGATNALRCLKAYSVHRCSSRSRFGRRFRARYRGIEAEACGLEHKYAGQKQNVWSEYHPEQSGSARDSSKGLQQVRFLGLLSVKVDLVSRRVPFASLLRPSFTLLVFQDQKMNHPPECQHPRAGTHDTHTFFPLRRTSSRANEEIISRARTHTHTHKKTKCTDLISTQPSERPKPEEVSAARTHQQPLLYNPKFTCSCAWAPTAAAAEPFHTSEYL